MAEKKGKSVEIREMNQKERKEFESTMDFLCSEMKALHQQSIIMEHEARREAAHAFLNC